MRKQEKAAGACVSAAGSHRLAKPSGRAVFGAVSACCGSLCDVVPRCRKRSCYGVGMMSEREDYEINLRQLSKELNQYQGNLWTVIISLSREDAERLSFDTAARWRDFLRSERSEIAEQFHIPQGNLRWYAAFHNEKHHPHVHLMVWSEGENAGLPVSEHTCSCVWARR